jgi:hypothetical protein
MKKIILFILLLIASSQANAAIQATHPRILMYSQADFDAVAYRCGIGTQGSYSAEIQSANTWQEMTALYSSMKSQYDSLSVDWYRYKKTGHIMALCLLHRFEGSGTIDYKGYIYTLITTNITDPGNYDGYNIPALAIAYDWLYDDWSGPEKDVLSHGLMMGADYYTWGRDKNTWSGHFMYEWFPYLPMAYLALAGETLTDYTYVTGSHTGQTISGSTFLATCLANTTAMLEDDVVPAYNQVAGTSGGNELGWGTYWGTSSWMLQLVLQPWRDSGVADYITDSPALEKIIPSFIAGISPHRESLGHSISDNANSDWTTFSVNTLAMTMATAEKDSYSGYGKWALDKSCASALCEPWYDFTKAFRIIADIESISAVAPTTEALGDTYYNEGTGVMVYRTGYDDTISNASDNMSLMFRCGDYFDGHQHLNNGDLQIFYKGDLLSQSGKYRGDTAGADYFSYYKRTIASNSVLIRDPSESFYSYLTGSAVLWTNDGGQHFSYSGTATVPYQYGDGGDGSYWDFGDVEDYEDNALYIHVQGDYTASYNSGKASNVKRGMIIVKGADKDIILWDYIDIPSGKVATCTVSPIFHSIDQPTITGTLGTDNRNAYGGGDVTYSDVSLIKITDDTTSYTTSPAHVGGDGILYIAPIYPTGNRVTVIGGAADDDGRYQADSFEFVVDGAQIPLYGSVIDTPAPGVYRAEISYQSTQQNSLFLNVMHVTDNGSDTPDTTSITATQGGLIGVQLKHDTIDRVVMIPPTHEHVATTVEFSVTPDSGALTQCYVVGLDTSGDYSIGVTGTTEKTVIVDPLGSTYQTSSDGLLAFSVAYSDNAVVLLSSEGSSSTTTWYLDADGDGWSEGTTQQSETDPGPTWYELSELTGTTDCNDSNAAINPGATEICGNGVDEDCDGTAQACATVKGFIKGGYSG